MKRETLMELDGSWLALGAGIALAAGTLRGYSGFGFAMTLALGLLLFMPPLQAITTVLLLDLLGALGLARRAWVEADHAVLGRLLPAMLVATLAGIGLMLYLPTTVMRMLVALICLAGALATLVKPRHHETTPPRSRDLVLAVPAGAASGLAMSIASAGGPPLMLYLMHTTLNAQRARATAILFFIVTSAMALLGYAWAGEVTRHTLLWTALLLPGALLGSAIGQWSFQRYPPRSFRTVVTPLLIVMASWILLSELWGYLGPF